MGQLCGSKEWKMKNWQRVDTKKAEGKRRQGTPRLRWEERPGKVGEDWRTTARYRRNWRVSREHSERKVRKEKRKRSI